MEEAKKRMTAGIIFKYGQVVLDEKVLELVEEKEQKVVSERDASKKKAIIEYNQRKEEGMAVLTPNKQCEALTVSELNAIVHWGKCKSDKAVPSGKPALQERYTNTISRADRSLDVFLTDSGYYRNHNITIRRTC